MSKRFGWLLGLAGLVLVGFLIACGTTYNAQSNGLVIVSSQGVGLLETYSFDLNGGGNVNGISNPPESTANLTCVLGNGLPGPVVIDPAGAYAYAIITENPTLCGNNSQPGIQAFKINSSGEISTAGSLVADPNPVALVMDTTGKFLFVAEGCFSPTTTNPIQPCLIGHSTPNPVRTYAIGSGGSLTAVPSTYNLIPPAGFQTPNIVSLFPTPMTLPPAVNGVQTAVCSSPGNTPPTTEYLYAADAVNAAVWEFGVDTSTGAITNPPTYSQAQTFPAGQVPSGVVVDPCNRFVYVTNLLSNQISGYTICNGLPTQSQNCPNPKNPDGSLQPITGSPFSLTTGNGPGPIVADPFGNHLYVLDTLSNQVTPFQISPVSGSLKAGSVVVTGVQPTAIAIRGDGNWLFVANYNTQPPGISQYEVTPLTGDLTALPAIDTDNYPYGIAVK